MISEVVIKQRSPTPTDFDTGPNNDKNRWIIFQRKPERTQEG